MLKCMNKNIVIVFISIVLSFVGFGCVPRSSYTLLHDMKPDSLYGVKYDKLAVVKPQDRINIIVRSKKNATLALPFNSPDGAVSVNDESSIKISNISYGRSEYSGNQQYSNSRSNIGYLVDEDGNIIFPILGKISVSGLNLKQISEKIEDLLKKGGYMADPLVESQFVDFRVYLINGTGGTVINSPNDKFSILQAVSQGLSVGQQFRIDHIAVIRKDKDGKNQIYFCNLLNTDVFKSPVYYLEPGDIVYVQPKYQRAEAVDLDNVFKYTSYIFTTVFTITSILNIFNK